MVNEAAEAKIRFLEATARHYASSAPETSAHLMAQRNIEAADNGLSPNRNQSNGTCKGCGSILLPGWTSRTSIIKKSGTVKPLKVGSKKRPRSNASDLARYLRVDCLLCYRYEERPLQGLTRKSKNPLKSSSELALVGSESQQPPSPIHDASAASTSQTQASKPLAPNINSKKRAKARKQGGLQAMLEKSKASTGPSSGFGLDLMDLMKQG